MYILYKQEKHPPQCSLSENNKIMKLRNSATISEAISRARTSSPSDKRNLLVPGEAANAIHHHPEVGTINEILIF